MARDPDAHLRARKHGAYAFRDSGEKALEPEKRSRLMELREQVQDRSTLLDLMQQKAADGVLMFELMQSYVAGEIKRGALLPDIPVLNKLPAFYNSMNRALSTLLANMPENSSPYDAELDHIQQVINGHNEKD
jgi:hypothetical protein